MTSGGDVVGHSQRLGEGLLTRNRDHLGVAGDSDNSVVRSSSPIFYLLGLGLVLLKISKTLYLISLYIFVTYFSA